MVNKSTVSNYNYGCSFVWLGIKRYSTSDSLVVDVYTVITRIALRETLDVRPASSAYLHMTTLKTLGFVESLLFSCLITCIGHGDYLYKILSEQNSGEEEKTTMSV